MNATPQISLVIPTLNEQGNIRPLVQAIAAAMEGRSYEIILVDDNSRDSTVAVANELSGKFPVRVLERKTPCNGLSGAVLDGFEFAWGGILLVMDADLQHPPAKIPELLNLLESDEADFVLGSRYMAGGSCGEKWGVFRQINSRVATLLARPFAGKITDPMSGFFALKRATYLGAQRLTPLGYKIGLELICKCRVQRVKEVPIHFAERTAGESKLSIKQQFRYLEHLSRLYDFCFPRLSPMMKFFIVTAICWLVGFGTFLILMQSNPESAVLPTSVAYLAAILITAIFHARYVRTQREFIVRKRPWMDFWFSSLAEWAVCSLAAVYLASRFQHPWPLELFVIPFTAAMGIRYILRKEFLLDVRGLRRDLRLDDVR